jgi:hypothetical protein
MKSEKLLSSLGSAPERTEPEFLNFQGPQASIRQNRTLVRINSVVELILEWGGGREHSRFQL